ncbi:hypothetical protein NEUTE1DRAFT_119701 [Neurospora tetrasperma FGSC 2508]|uniref:Reverse transcriptase domain-containing protein n=1 Tax=Neurospora tetrasperma (strain FGSC 2508 / ATCC MYA-4615 / P0657) TaxID=510951 RepID=F8MCZ7_NEUT8|nr:uncharacterized protein NEUTE1DRAFT_119701 [Neurospora tetrasperma FGSC 2508]EGO60541.1 hypothetical protein NEUTE1DRAFT_119701 [Neurospora tetrasperma FGSC 2508]EGZ75483.1 hypothetical protein NEUTE2DRAFT_155932 [Neurospora tetrasperma FGSC 2509]
MRYLFSRVHKGGRPPFRLPSFLVQTHSAATPLFWLPTDRQYRAQSSPSILSTSYQSQHTRFFGSTPANMAASSEVLSQTLSSITSIKLDQLQKQKDAYESAKDALLSAADKEADVRKRAETLLDGREKLPSIRRADNPMLSADNMKRFVEQAAFDPSVSKDLLREYEETVKKELDMTSNKYRFASMYGRMVREWTAASGQDKKMSVTEGGDKADKDDFVPVGRKEMHEQRKTWEEFVFTPKETDKDAIKRYLEDVFAGSSKDCKRALAELRKSFEKLQDNKNANWSHPFTVLQVKVCIQSILRSNNITGEKRSTLRDFLNNSVVLQEIADVLNMRMDARASWTWEAPVVVEQRRALNGKYRFFLDEDLLHSLLLEYIFRRWAVLIRQHFGRFTATTGVWKPDTKPMSKQDARRRQFFLDEKKPLSDSVAYEREDYFHGKILLDHLPEWMSEVRGGYDSSEADSKEDTRDSPLRVVQGLMHRLEADILVQTHMGNELTVLRSDFQWFGPGLPHSSIFAVMEFFGFNEEWLDFFKRVLEAPLRFKGDPNPDTPFGIRKRGTPISSTISDVVGESLLFCLDFAVNQKADGTPLYRLHDDMWLWGTTEKCSKAWKVVTEFSEVMGLSLNEEKTGSAIIHPKNKKVGLESTKEEETAKTSHNLPTGPVTWGLLKLNASTGHFEIDESKVDEHIDELRRQLGACQSVFDWVQAWNIYGDRFFTNFFGRPAACSGRAHVDSMLAMFARIQQKLFPDHAGGVGAYVKDMIASRFGISSIPDGYLFFPTSMGGLGLRNPFVSLFLIRDDLEKTPEEMLADYEEEEERAYRRAKERFETYEMERAVNKTAGGSTRGEDSFKDLEGEPFMSYEEFTRYRELTSPQLKALYQNLLMEPTTRDVELKGDIKAALEDEDDWRDMSSYDKWVVQLFHREVVDMFGGLTVVDKAALPIGLITMLRQSRFHWQG